jgi:hypothetical protein
MWLAAATMCIGTIATSCNDDVDNSRTELAVKGEYVLAATVSPDGTDVTYLLGAESLESGALSTRKEGFEATGGTWIFFGDKALYNLQYNQGEAGVTESYALNAEGKLYKRPGVYNITRFTTYGVAGENIVTVSAVDTKDADAEGNKKKGLGFNFLHAADETTSTKTIAGEDFLGNGEYVTFAGLVERGGKVYTSVVPMGMSKWAVRNYTGEFDHSKVADKTGGSGSGAFDIGVIPGTQYPDQAFVAIYDNTAFDGTPVIVSTDQMGYACGRMRSQYYQTLWAADNGDIYVFSPGYGRMTTGEFYTTGTLGAKVMRIKGGATTFDDSYGAVDLEALAGGKSFLRTWHISGDYFLLQMYTGSDTPGGLDTRGTGATRLAVYKGSDKSFYYVDGIPASDQVTAIGGTPYTENGAIYIPIVASGEHAIYKIDPATHSATRGLEVEAQSIDAVGRLAPR